MKQGTFVVHRGDETHKVEMTGHAAKLDEGPSSFTVDAEDAVTYLVSHDGVRHRVTVVSDGPNRHAFVDGQVFEFEVQLAGGRRSASRTHSDQLTAPMPARVTRILVVPGDTVTRGDVVVTLEAMKMELPVRAPRDGTIRSVGCETGQLVQPGVPLVELV